MFARLYLLFSWSQIFLIPIILTVEEQKNFALSYMLLMILAVSTGTSYIIFIQHHHEIFPYRTIFFNQVITNVDLFNWININLNINAISTNFI